MTLKTITQAHPPMPLAELVPAIKGFRTQSSAEQLSLLSDLVRIHPTLNMVVRRLDYWRARTFPPGHAPLHIDELIWRKNVPARAGRANPEGFPVLYMANKPETTFREIGVEDEATVLAKFQICSGNSVHIAPIGEFAQMYTTGRGRLAIEESHELVRILLACDREELSALLITDLFLQRCMASDVAPYQLSSHIAHEIFQKNHQVGAISFESTKLPGSINLAVRTDKFWDNWGIESVWSTRAQHLAEGVYCLSEHRNVGTIHDSGGLSWEKDYAPPFQTIHFSCPWRPNEYRGHSSKIAQT